MEFTGYIGQDLCTFTLGWAGYLMASYPDGRYERYNDEVYDSDSFSTVREMLIRDGVRGLTSIRG